MAAFFEDWYARKRQQEMHDAWHEEQRRAVKAQMRQLEEYQRAQQIMGYAASHQPAPKVAPARRPVILLCPLT